MAQNPLAVLGGMWAALPDDNELDRRLPRGARRPEDPDAENWPWVERRRAIDAEATRRHDRDMAQYEPIVLLDRIANAPVYPLRRLVAMVLGQR